MIKVLQINAGSENFGGVSSMLLNIYRNIDRTKIQFDFLTPNKTTYEMHRDEIEDLGGHIYDFRINIEGLIGKLKYMATLNKFLKGHHYDIVHINSGWLSFNCITAVTVKLSKGKQKIIIHSHSDYYRNWWKRVICIPLKWIMERLSQSLLACSEAAARNMFLSKTVKNGSVMIVKDGIPIAEYAYNEKKRDVIRRDLGIENCFVVGHVGRFVEQKNHDFLINVFKEICKNNNQAVLLLVGQGELEDRIKERICCMGLMDKVMFLGQRDDMSDLYQAMDVFCFPSLNEGLGMVLIEAQASGLPCFISEKIPQEVDVTDLVHRLSIQEDSEVWAQAILGLKSGRRKDYSQALINKGYSIEATTQTISRLYETLFNK